MTQPQLSSPPAPPAEPRRNGVTGRVLTGLGVGIAAVVVAFGALFLVDLSMSSTATAHESYDAVDSVQIVTDGDVTVRAGEGDIEVDVIAHSGLREPTYSADGPAGTLELTHRCGWAVALPRCSGELDVTLPAGTEVVVRTENGDVVASGLAGEVSLDSSNGSVETTDIGGVLSARTSNGDIDIRASAADVDASSSNGDISVTDVDGSVTTVTSSGEISIDSVTGDASAETSNGDVEVSAVDGSVDGRSDNGEVTVTGDGEPVALTIETSNGDQVIEGPTDPDAERTVDIRSSNGDVAYLSR
ncbi:DUF4097 family beta strand repeat-containing protein [Promicromonospora xylanilytica]